MPWLAIGLIAGIGLASLVCGLSTWVMDRDGGEKRVIFGGGLLGAAIVLAIGKVCYELARMYGWLA